MTSITAAMLEGVGVALVFPILQDAANLNSTKYPFPFHHLIILFSGLSLAQRLQAVAILLFIAIFLKNLFVFISYCLSAKLQLVVMKHFRMRCFDQIMRVGMNYFNKQRASDMQLIIDGYTESVTGAIVALIGRTMPYIFTTLILLVFLFLLSWKLTIISLLLVFISSLVLYRVTKNILIASKLLYEERMNFNRTLLDVITGMKLIRLFDRKEC